jgi:predicted ATP-dependent endonuclease of OLD family
VSGIVRLQSENVKRIHAVDITPGDEALVVIGGRNEAGKSSVLDSIAYVLGGEKLIPTQPIRNGETEAKVVADLGDLIVTRRFKREIIKADVATIDGVPTTAAPVFGPTTSILTVTNREGARYPSPQAVLDKLYNMLAFDPLAFSKETPKKQDEVLRRLVQLDFTELNQRRKTESDIRAMVKKTLAIAELKLEQLPKHAGVPDAEVSLDEVSKQMLEAESYRKLAEDAEREVDKAATIVTNVEKSVTDATTTIDELQKKLDLLITNRATLRDSLHGAKNNLDAKKITAQAARAVVPDVEVVHARLKEVETTNAKVRANKARAQQEIAVHDLHNTVSQHSVTIQSFDDEKAAKLAAAEFPVPGLGLSDEGVTYQGLPFEEVSASVQLRTSVAVGLALNDKLKVLLVRNGNLLDDEHMKVLAEMATAAGAQIWVEYVTSNDEGVTVMIEDGRVIS